MEGEVVEIQAAVDEDAAVYDFERPLTLVKCPACERRFKTAEALRQHMKATKHGR